MEIFLTVRGDLILSGNDQLMELLFLAGLGLEGGEKPTALGRSTPSVDGKNKDCQTSVMCYGFFLAKCFTVPFPGTNVYNQ